MKLTKEQFDILVKAVVVLLTLLGVLDVAAVINLPVV